MITLQRFDQDYIIVFGWFSYFNGTSTYVV